MDSAPIKDFEGLYIHIKDKGSTVFEKSFTQIPIYIGRGLENDIPLPQYDWISRKHAKIEMCEEGLFLKDLNSSNGITIRGQHVHEVLIYAGLSVRVGPLTVEFDFNEETYKPLPYPELPPNADETISVLFDLSTQTGTSCNSVTKPYAGKEGLETQFTDINFSDHLLSTKTNVSTDASEPSVAVNTDLEETQRKGLLSETYVSGLDTVQHNRPYLNIGSISSAKLAVEVTVSWNENILDTMICREGELLFAGRSQTSLYLPVFRKNIPLIDFRKKNAFVLLPTKKGTVARLRGDSLIADEVGLAGRHVRGQKWHLRPDEAITMDLGKGIQIHTRFIPAPRQLSKKPLAEFDSLLKKAVGASTVAHIAVLLFAAILPAKPAPKIKNLPERIAKLLVPKKPDLPPPPEKITVVKNKLVKKTQKARPKKQIVRKRKLREPRKVVVRPNKKIKRLNRVTTRVSFLKRVSKEKPTRTKKINQLGALAALGALDAPSPTRSNKPVSLNINKNAGGLRSKNKTSVLIGTLQSKNGRMAASTGMTGIRTKGKGFGTGSGYGVQGLKGTAGKRGISGAVIGAPQLMNVKRTEGLTHKQVMDVVKRRAGRIQQCYESSLLSSPGLQGRIEYKWHIKPNGRVKWAKVKNSNIRNADRLNNCVIRVFSKMNFPKSKNGASTEPSIGFPFGRL